MVIPPMRTSSNLPFSKIRTSSGSSKRFRTVSSIHRTPGRFAAKERTGRSANTRGLGRPKGPPLQKLEKTERAELQGQIDDLDKEVAAEHAFGPGGVEIGERLGGGSFLVGFAGSFQFLDAVDDGDEHVARTGEVGFVAER